MGKGKLAKFADMASYPHVFEYPHSVVEQVPFEMRGKWREQFFKNDNPIVLELGCGRGEYTVGLGRMYPDKNFIGVDIKGARMWTGATDSLREGMTNVAFLRTNIEIIDRFFAEDEVDEVWITFPDPQMKKVTKRLTSTAFLHRYASFLKTDGIIHLKTDSNFLYAYTDAKSGTQRNHLHQFRTGYVDGPQCMLQGYRGCEGCTVDDYPRGHRHPSPHGVYRGGRGI